MGAVDPAADDVPVGRDPERRGEHPHQVTAVGAELGSRLSDGERLKQTIIEHLRGCTGEVRVGQGQAGLPAEGGISVPGRSPLLG